ncbi:dUTP diphosphatase [Jeotgalibaca porci]|uniref:dUTP diphosphatase n=1 Tax=Jeotgalibaca porci TaxID=1868793 RepID=UPI0035A0DD40
MSDQPIVLVEKIDNKAIVPCKPKSFFDAGWDVYSLERVVIPAGGDALLSTGLRMAIPNGYCIQVNPRSGKATRDKLVIGARIIDAPYRGELKIHIINFGKEEVEISPNDPCAQLLILRTAGVIVEGAIEDLNTERGSDGFGSSNSDLIKIAKEAREIDITELGTTDGYTTLLSRATVKTMDAQKWPESRATVSNPEFFVTKEDATNLPEAVSTLVVLRQRIDRGDLKGTYSELAKFKEALKVVVNHLQ